MMVGTGFGGVAQGVHDARAVGRRPSPDRAAFPSLSRESTMKTFVLAIAAALVLGACATGPRLPDDQRTQIYRAAAGEPVGNFHYFGTLDGWKSISETALVVWVRARHGYLLDRKSGG